MDIHRIDEFTGRPKKIRIVSAAQGFGKIEPGLEIEQRLSMDDRGNGWLTRYCYGEDGGHELFRKEKISMGGLDAELILGKAASFFRTGYTDPMACDAGIWHLELINTEGKRFRYSGSIAGGDVCNGISGEIREKLGRKDLFLLDGNVRTDAVDRITISYNRTTRLDHDRKRYVWEYTENMTIDRESGVLENVREVSSGCRVIHRYEMADAIEKLLDSFDADELFEDIETDHHDLTESPGERRDYCITVIYRNRPAKIILGSFDRAGLPEDYEEFVEKVFDFLRSYGTGEIYGGSLYRRRKRRKKEFIYCSVIFQGQNRIRYYRTDDETIEAGDLVIVPSGERDEEKIAEVVAVEYFKQEEAPYPVRKTKKVIRRCRTEDLEPEIYR